MTIIEKAAYLKGLTDGLGVDPQTKDGKLWSALNDLLADMAHEIEALHETDLGQAKALDGVADELSYLEELCGGFDSEDEPACGKCACACVPEDEADEVRGAKDEYQEAVDEYQGAVDDYQGAVDDYQGAVDKYQEAVNNFQSAVDDYQNADDEDYRSAGNDEGDEELKYDGVIYDATCPVCGKEISFDEQTLMKGSIQCPKCGETLEFDLGEDDNDVPEKEKSDENKG